MYVSGSLGFLIVVVYPMVQRKTISSPSVCVFWEVANKETLHHVALCSLFFSSLLFFIFHFSMAEDQRSSVAYYADPEQKLHGRGKKEGKA